jgi:putative ABC transport system permease protein
MRSLLLQITALTVMNLKGLPKRFWLSLSTVIAVTLVVVVLLAFLAMRNGFQHTLASAGADDVAMILRAGSQSEVASVITRDQIRLIEEAPGIAKSPNGKPLVSAELYLVVDGVKHASQTKANLPLRGIGQEGMAVRKGIHIIAGRMFSPGTNEIVVGKALLSEFDGLQLGQTVTFGTSQWKVVGVFAAEGSVFESEIWADLPVLQSFFKRDNVFQTVRARLVSPAALGELQRYLDSDPRLKLEAKSEAAYFAEQASGTSDLIQKLGWPLATAMAFGALAGALNTMYSSVAARTTEIATLRAIGFGGLPAFVSTLVESAVLAALGGLIGVSAAFLVFNGLSASTLGASFTQVVFTFEVTPALAAQGVSLALIVGLIGGIFPSVRAARMPILAGLYGS